MEYFVAYEYLEILPSVLWFLSQASLYSLPRIKRIFSLRDVAAGARWLEGVSKMRASCTSLPFKRWKELDKSMGERIWKERICRSHTYIGVWQYSESWHWQNWFCPSRNLDRNENGPVCLWWHLHCILRSLKIIAVTTQQLSLRRGGGV